MFRKNTNRKTRNRGKERRPEQGKQPPGATHAERRKNASPFFIEKNAVCVSSFLPPITTARILVSVYISCHKFRNSRELGSVISLSVVKINVRLEAAVVYGN